MASPDDDPDVLNEIIYYGREKLYHHIQNTVLEGRRKRGGTPVLVFWNAFSLMMEGSLSEAMLEFKQINFRDVVLCTTLALIHCHKLCPTVDRDAVQKLDSKMREERKTCGEMGWYHAGMFLWMVGRHDKAREYIARVLKGSPDNVEACTLYGWIDLTCGRDSLIKKSVDYFDRVINKKDTLPYIPPDCYLGKARFFEIRKEFGHALDLINLAIVEHTSFTPVLVEKCRVLLAMKDWDQCYDATQRIISQSPTCIEGYRYEALYLQCKEGKSQEAAEKLGRVIELIDRYEPSNHRLCYETSRIFSRVACGNQHLLQQTGALLDRARSLAPNASDYVTESACQRMMMRGKGSAGRDAISVFRTALKLDETSVAALTGIIWCQLLEGIELDDAEQQLEFLTELQSSIGQSSDLYYLHALLAEKKALPTNDIVAKLREAQKHHSEWARKVPVGFEYFVQFNPDFTLRLVKFLMNYASEDGVSSVKMLNSCELLLVELTSRAPGMIEGLYLTAKLWVLKGDFTRAQTGLSECIKLDPTYSPALLLSAELSLKKGDVIQCRQQLDVGLSHNFEVRENPRFHLLRSRACVQENNYHGAEDALVTAIGLPGVKKTENSTLPLAERAMLFTELCAIYKHLGKMSEATAVIAEATKLFAGTSEQYRIIVANADLTVVSDVDGAIALLRSVTPADPYYVISHEKMAEIYLKQRKDQRMYIKCFEDLTEHVGSARCYDLLGDALMTVKEPGRAIDAYQKAIKKDPHNGQMASKAGKAMIHTHNYNRAITYYETAVKLGKQTQLRYDLAELHMKIHQYEKVEKVVSEALEAESGADTQSRESRVKFLLLQAKVWMKSDTSKALETLTLAKEEQSNVLRSYQTGDASSTEIEEQKQKAADICCQSALLFLARQDHEAAVRLYQEALLFMENYEKALVALAEMYLNMDNLDACYQHCITILRHITNHEVATMMIAEVQFRKEQYDLATFHFEQLLEKSPTHFVALSRLIDLMRRLGKLKDAEDFLKEAEKHTTVTTPAGLHYCRGLYKRFSGNPTSALQCFNLARKDKDWGERAIWQMIDICLYPDGETLGGEVLAAVESDSGRDRQDSEEMALRTAKRLLQEWSPTSESGKMRKRVVEGHLVLRRKEKPGVEEAILMFMDIVQPTERGGQSNDYTPAIVGMVTGYMMIKQFPRARSQMKRIARKVWNFDEAEDLERGWLLMVDHYISAGRTDEAQKTLARIIQYNQSCSKAWEYHGHLHEKANNFNEAAKNYENAWRFSSQSNAVIGYKLAFNYMKAQRNVDAVEVCYKVLELHPNYPRIRKDILEKARALIRV